MTDWLWQFFHRVASVFRREKLDHELDAELAAHLELATEENLQRGLPPNEARRQALIRFGGKQQAIEQHRDARGLPGLEILFQDLRYAVRALFKNPGFTIAVVVTLALGIAVNATMFSLVSAFLLRRPVVHQPDRVVVVSSVNPARGFLPDTNPVSPPNYFAWREANDVFSDLSAAEEYRTVSLTAAQGKPQALPSAAVSSNYFDVLGVAAHLGRTFADGDDQPGRDHVVIVSHELWQRSFGSNPSLIGSTIRLNRENYVVIGVMPASFRLLGFTPQVWTPLTLTVADRAISARKDHNLHVFARLKPGVTLEQARLEITNLARRSEQDFPETEKGWSAAVRTLPDFLVYNFGIRNGLAVMMTAVGFVLMMACANVAGLLLARATGRQKELGIRIALGAGRLRIIRQLLTEGLLNALIGGGVALVLAYWGVNFVATKMTFNEAISAVPLTLDRNVLLFVLGVSVFSAVLCSLAPALRASRTDINTALKVESRAASAGRSHSRLRTILVTGEIALAMFLLIGTGLLIRGIYLLEHQNLGFQPEHLLTAGITLDSARYKDAVQQTSFVQEIMSRLQHIPGAGVVAVTSDLPATGPASVTVQIKGEPDLPANQARTARDAVVSTDYFSAAEIPVLRGRTFTEMDNATSSPVVLVNQEFVHRHLRDQEPLGKQIRLNVTGPTPKWSEIVGVVANVKNYSEAPDEDPEVYEPFLQRPVSYFSIMIRTKADPNGLASDLRSAIEQADADLPLLHVMSMSAVIDLQKGGDVLFVRMLGVFALLALIFAAIGIYGLIAYSVGQRTHEIGIRVALGAGTKQVLRMVLLEGLKMTAIGAAVGLLLALPLPKVFDAMFSGLRFSEPRLYLIVPLAILAVSLLATYIPARRAASVDPTIALRNS
jgi:putative ABC transport system permease protein